jgi:hypothetical protein
MRVLTGVIALLLPAVGLVACGSQIPTLKDWADPLVGKNVADLRTLSAAPGSYSSRTGWQQRSYHLGNGNWVYVQPDRPECEIHFEINSEDLIVGYTPVGTGCRYQ